MRAEVVVQSVGWRGLFAVVAVASASVALLIVLVVPAGQGLWAAPWLMDVPGLDRSAVVEHLTLMAAVLSASALLLGTLGERLRRAGISTELFLAATLALSMAAQLALLLRLPVSSHLLFAIIAAAGAATVLSFGIMARYFPKEVAGRANAALGVLNMGTAFGLQCLGGSIIARRPAPDGHYLPMRTRRPWRLA